MSKYFKNVTSYENLKSQFKELLKANHPDNGGDVEVMKEINCEYDALFKIWKDRHEKATGETIKETAESTKRHFYTEYGWEGSRYDSNMTLKEISKIVKTYTKEKYPLCKFSVRTKYASMCQELKVECKEVNHYPFKTFEDMTEEDKSELRRIYGRGWGEIWKLSSWMPGGDDEKAEFERIWSEYPTTARYRTLTDDYKEMLEDINAFVNSYNYDDSDSMIDYFDVNFYYFNCEIDNDTKVVPKTERITQRKNEVTQRNTANKKVNNEVPAIETDYTIEQSKHTKTNNDIWLVKIVRTLSREEYIEENKKMRALGGYYSKFTHSFIFDYDPTAKLTA